MLCYVMLCYAMPGPKSRKGPWTITLLSGTFRARWRDGALVPPQYFSCFAGCCLGKCRPPGKSAQDPPEHSNIASNNNIWDARPPAGGPGAKSRRKAPGQSPSFPARFECVGEIGHLCRVAFFVLVVTLSGSAGRQKVGPKTPYFSPGLTHGC